MTIAPGRAAGHARGPGARGDTVPVAIARAPGRRARRDRRRLDDPLVLRIAGWRGVEEDVYRADVRVSAAEDPDRRRNHRAPSGAARAAGAARRERDRDRARRCSPSRCPASPVRLKSPHETTIFTRGALTEVAQHDIRVNGVDMNVGAAAPRLPIIEPERVSTPPLAIALSNAYDYRLAGREPRGRTRLLHRRVHAAGRGGALVHGAGVD